MDELSLDPVQLDRYSRHIIMEEIGPAGQARLLDGSVLVIGAGGLGSPVIQYLAAAGVGHIGIVDDDVVERSNLQRQIIHADADVGKPKVASASAFVERLNPDVTVDAYETRFDIETVDELLPMYDFVVDASDNFPTRYLVNDACVLKGIPFAHGAIFKFEGQATSVVPDGPCYRCLFREAPPPGTVPDCATTGVLGVLPGVVGAIQATETVRWFIDGEVSLSDALLAYNARHMEFQRLPLEADPTCPVCGSDAIDSIGDVDYEETCRVAVN